MLEHLPGAGSALCNEQSTITPANTPEALGDKIIELLRDPARYQTLRTQAWQWSKTITFDQSYADFTKVLNLTTTPNQSRQEVPTP